jgi:hypothetical protein
MAAGSKTQPRSLAAHPCRFVARPIAPHGRQPGSVAGGHGPGKGREVRSNGDGVVS